MLQHVPLPESHLSAYRDAAGEEAVERVRAFAEPLVGAKVLHINSTPYGGGVAEHLSSHTPLLRDLGIQAEWRVLHVTDEFLTVTKTMHNGLQGMDVRWTREMEHVYADTLRAHARAFESGWDIVVVHDPQPAALLPFLDEISDEHHRARWLWRCHIDLTTAQPAVWEFLRTHVARYDATIWTMEEFVPDALDGPDVLLFPPSIDPLARRTPSCRTRCSRTRADRTG